MYVCMYVCIMYVYNMYVWLSLIAEYEPTRQECCQSCSWSAKQGKLVFHCPRSRLKIWSRVTSSAVRSPVNLLFLRTQAESGSYSRGDSSRFPRRRLFIIPPTAIGSVPSLPGHTIAYRWRSLLRVCRHRDNSPQGSSSNGCCLFRYHHRPIIVRLSFPTPPTMICRGHV